MTVLLTTHYMEEADTLCERIALMHHGRIRSQGTPAELKARLGPGATLDDVFRHDVGTAIEDEERTGGGRDVRRPRRTAQRLGCPAGSGRGDAALVATLPEPHPDLLAGRAAQDPARP